MFTFIESAAFERVRVVYLDDDEYAELQQFMMENPEAGDVVRKSGSVRKLRWRRKGRGKRGGLRVIYFVRYQPNEFWMLTIYAKAKHENVPTHILKQLLEAFRFGARAIIFLHGRGFAKGTNHSTSHSRRSVGAAG